MNCPTDHPLHKIRIWNLSKSQSDTLAGLRGKHGSQALLLNRELEAHSILMLFFSGSGSPPRVHWEVEPESLVTNAATVFSHTHTPVSTCQLSRISVAYFMAAIIISSISFLSICSVRCCSMHWDRFRRFSKFNSPVICVEIHLSCLILRPCLIFKDQVLHCGHL